MVVDAYCHLEPELEPAALIEAMDGAGIERTVLLAAAHVPVQFPKIGPALHRACMSCRPLRRPMYRLTLASRRFKPYARPK